MSDERDRRDSASYDQDRLNVRSNHFALLAKLFIRCPTLTRADVHRF
jgi:hypothetical protein